MNIILLIICLSISNNSITVQSSTILHQSGLAFTKATASKLYVLYVHFNLQRDKQVLYWFYHQFEKSFQKIYKW